MKLNLPKTVRISSHEDFIKKFQEILFQELALA